MRNELELELTARLIETSTDRSGSHLKEFLEKHLNELTGKEKSTVVALALYFENLGFPNQKLDLDKLSKFLGSLFTDKKPCEQSLMK